MLTKMTVSFRLFLYFSIGASLLLMLAIFSIVELRSVNSIAAFEQNSATRTRMAGELADSVSEFRLGEANYLLAADRLHAAEAQADMADHLKANADYRVAYLPLITSEEERRLFATLERTWAVYAARHVEFMGIARTDKNRATSLYAGALQAAYKAADTATDDLSDYILEGAKVERARAQSITDNVLGILIGISLLTFCMAIILLFLIRSQVGRPLAAITRALSTVAGGDLNVEVPGCGRHDEIGALACAVDVFIKTARQLDQAHREVEEAHRQVEALARHDALTGLPNRRLLAEEMVRTLSRIRRKGGTYAIFVIDLDRFKPVNDVYGHAAGDTVLCEVANRLKDVLRKSEVLARLGGDEFAVIAEFTSEQDGPMRLAGRLIKAASHPIAVNGTVIEVGATIGVSLAPQDGSDPDSLLRSADIAMYRGKRQGGGCFRFFEESMETELRARVQLEAELRAAIPAGEIMPHYQPVVSLADQRLLGFEILARWHHPEKGLLPPAAFIPVVDEIGMMLELTCSMLHTACRDAKQWPAHLTLALNIAPSQLKDPQLPVRLLSILLEEGFPPERLEVEVTEDALVADMDQARAILKSLQNIGIRIALDDFGTGYSSLHHLRELHFDKIKIDRSFIQSIFENQGNRSIVSAIIQMGKGLGMPTTAEGIEDIEHVQKLIELGCENGQGYYFGKAMTAAEAARLIGSKTRSAESRGSNAKGLRAAAG